MEYVIASVLLTGGFVVTAVVGVDDRRAADLRTLLQLDRVGFDYAVNAADVLGQADFEVEVRRASAVLAAAHRLTNPLAARAPEWAEQLRADDLTAALLAEVSDDPGLGMNAAVVLAAVGKLPEALQACGAYSQLELEGNDRQLMARLMQWLAAQ